MKTGIELIAAERQEQIEKHGRTIELDVKLNTDQQLIQAAARLTLNQYDGTRFTSDESGSKMTTPFRWDEYIWDKMNRKPYKERLIIAGALIAAEIDRIQATESTPKIEAEGKELPTDEKIVETLTELEHYNPYPESVFTPIKPRELKKIIKLLRDNGYSTDCLYGNWGRKVWDNCVLKAKELFDRW